MGLEMLGAKLSINHKMGWCYGFPVLDELQTDIPKEEWLHYYLSVHGENVTDPDFTIYENTKQYSQD